MGTCVRQLRPPLCHPCFHHTPLSRVSVEQSAPLPQGRGEGGLSPPALLTGITVLTAAVMLPDSLPLSASWEQLPLVAGWLGR